MAAVPAGLATALQDRYRLDRELGHGGMATVYLAEDPKHRRQVAIKVLKPELAATLGPARFLREITLTAQLNHPHILPLLDSGMVPDAGGERGGSPYYVMPYVEGESLRDRLNREKQLPLEDALQITREVADALSYAHSHHVIHRDIKPENILLESGHAVVADFGIARAISAAGGEKLTETGLAVGTPAYMSPEQAAGERELDGRSDEYALGCVLYEMLAGQPPFTGPTAESIVRQHIAAPVPNITVIRPGVPAHIAAALQRAMAKAPADRFGSARQFSEALSSVTQLEAFLTPSGGITPIDIQPVRRVGRRRSITLIATGVVLLFTAGFLGWRVFATRGVRSGPPRIVVLPPRNLGPPDQAYLADGIAEEINNRIASLSGLEVIGRTSAERYRETALTPRQIGTELSADYVLALRVGGGDAQAGRRIRVSAELLRARSESQLWGKSYQIDAAADYFRVQQDVAEQVASEMGVKLGAGDRQKIRREPTESQEAYDFFLRGNTILGSHYSAPLFRDAAGFLERAVELDPRFAQAWAALGLAHTELYWTGGRSPGQLELAREATEQAQALAPDAPETQYTLGYYYYHGFLDYPRALEHLRAAVRADSGRAEFHEAIGYVQRRAGNFVEAATSLARARQLDPSNARILRSLAETLEALGRPRDALPVIKRAVELGPEEFLLHVSLVLTYVESGQLDKATAAAQQAFVRPGLMQMLLQQPGAIPYIAVLLPDADRDKVASSFPPLAPEIGDTADYYLSRAEVLSLAGRGSRPSYDSAAIVIEKRIRARPDDEIGGGAAALGQAYRGLGRRDDAIRAGQRGVDLIGRDFFEGPDRHALLARTYLAFGERDSAAAEFGRYIVAVPGNRLEARYHPLYAQLRELPQIRKLLER
jgi:serine/threonine-protein kinase